MWTTSGKRRKCIVCNRAYRRTGPAQKYCSKCGPRIAIEVKRKHYLNSGRPGRQLGPVSEPRVCHVCGREYQPVGTAQMYCQACGKIRQKELSTKRQMKKTRQQIRPGQRRQSKRQEKSHVEGGHQPDNSGQPISERLLRALQSYEQAVRLTSQGRKSEKHEKIQFNDSLSLMSSIGPSTAIAILPDIWPERRKVSKATGFGFLYGMWHKKFRTYARDNYEINVTEQEAKDYRNTFFATYPKLSKWHERQRNFARRNGYVRSLTGRKRRLPKAQLRDDTPERREAERQAINSPVQSFASDINIMAALQIREEFNRDKVRICLTVHDSILMWVKPEWVVRVAKRVREIMQWPKLMDELGIEFTIPIDADVKIGPWSLGVSLDKWRKANAR
jgi:hypothetical protein